ncbi:MFS transporter [Streptomyces axinellae]|uniref:MFS transporter n=1 Tax=Streptomyces axinellae TaxID=552788 RepID=UPI0031D7F1E9
MNKTPAGNDTPARPGARAARTRPVRPLLPRRSPRPNRPPTLVLATASAVTAANVYLSQPLLAALAHSFGAGPDLLGAVPMATQLGYAAGILLLVPAGDSGDRRRLILRLGTASTVALAACALAPTVWWLIAASFALGLLSPVPQLVTPLAVALAAADGTDGADGGRAARGRVVGTVQGGLLIGVLASRAYSGALAEAVGWRGVYVCSAVMTLVLVYALRWALPAVPPAGDGSYRAALASLPRLAVHPLVSRIIGSGALVGIAFGAFWTALTFLLERGFHFGSATIGLFGLVAAASALASPWAGRAADRLGRRGALAALIGLVAVGWLLLLPGGSGLWWLIAGVIVVDVGVWGSQAACQTVLFTLDPAVHSRLNTLYFTFRFLGIAIGSLTGSLAWAHGGWPSVVATGMACTLAGLVVGLLPVRGGSAPAGDTADE